jgi:hypothetical protein
MGPTSSVPMDEWREVEKILYGDFSVGEEYLWL